MYENPENVSLSLIAIAKHKEQLLSKSMYLSLSCGTHCASKADFALGHVNADADGGICLGNS